MNPIRTATGLIQLPAHAAAAAMGTAAGLATTSAHRTARVIGWAVGRVTGQPPQQSPWTSGADARASDAPAADASAVREVVAPPTRTPAPKSTARTTTKKAPAKKAPSRKAAVVAPALGLTEAEAEAVLRTPSGSPAAEGTNPDTTETGLPQPGTEPLMDPATAKAVASESEVLRRAADTDKG